jgi:hypothetical protein
MNYIKEINAFYDWLELNELSKSAVLLWHALMHLNNKSGWQESFTVARSVIEAKTGLKKDAYYTARNQLKQAGLIDFKERGTKATVFRMFSLSEKQTTNQISEDNLSEKQTRDQTLSQTTNQTKTPTTTQTINKLKETKQNETKSKNTSRRKSRIYDEDSVYYRLALRLYERIKENNPDHKKPNLQKWADDVRLMMEHDHRTEEQIAYVIDWAQRDSFWKGNILSTKKLREKFDQLVIRIKEQINKGNKKTVSQHKSNIVNMPRAYQSLQEWAEDET